MDPCLLDSKKTNSSNSAVLAVGVITGDQDPHTECIYRFLLQLEGIKAIIHNINAYIVVGLEEVQDDGGAC